MAEVTLSLAALFEQAFGYKTRAFDPQFQRVDKLREQQGKAGAPYYAKDSLGQEYFMPVSISYPDTSSTASPPSGVTSDSRSFTSQKAWQLPYPVISIETTKTIVKTQLVERRGTVKEQINISDYIITIRGLIIGDDTFPEKDISTLRDIYERNTAISIQCLLTDIFLLRPDRSGSDQVVITDLKFPATGSSETVRPYELKLISDEIFNLLSIA
ncbi:MAG: hypothetical protein KF744_03095 [Taibaiella sp.]|nr:hypothetical protein [Taibaiella sp.]